MYDNICNRIMFVFELIIKYVSNFPLRPLSLKLLPFNCSYAHPPSPTKVQQSRIMDGWCSVVSLESAEDIYADPKIVILSHLRLQLLCWRSFDHINHSTKLYAKRKFNT